MRAVIVMAGLAALAAFPSSAAACSCGTTGSPLEDAKLTLDRSDAAFIGILKSVRVIDDGIAPGEPAPPPDAIFRYRVRRDFGADLGRYVRVAGGTSSAACGLPVDEGRKYAMGLTGRRGNWTSNLCSLVAPNALRQAAAEPKADRSSPGDC